MCVIFNQKSKQGCLQKSKFRTKEILKEEGSGYKNNTNSKLTRSLKWDFTKSIFLANFIGQGLLNKDPMIWSDGARPPPLVLLDLLLPENVFAKVTI